MSSKKSLDAGAYQRMVQTTEAKKPHHFEGPKEMVSTADVVSAARIKWIGEDISSKTKMSFKQQVSRQLRSTKSFLKGFWGSRKVMEDDEYNEEDGNKKGEDSNSNGEGGDEVSLMPESTSVSSPVLQIHGVSEAEASDFSRSVSHPEAVRNLDQSMRGQAPQLSNKSGKNLNLNLDQSMQGLASQLSSKSGKNLNLNLDQSLRGQAPQLSTKSGKNLNLNLNQSPPANKSCTMSAMGGTTSYESPFTNFGRQHYLKQGNWTGSPKGSGSPIGAGSPKGSGLLNASQSLTAVPIDLPGVLEAVLNWRQSTPVPQSAVKSEKHLGRHHHSQQGNWTSSQKGAGAAQGRAISSPHAFDRSLKFLAIEDSLTMIAVDRSVTSQSSGNSGCSPSEKPHPKRTVSCSLLNYQPGTGSPWGAGGAQGRAYFSPKVSDRIPKFLPIEESQPEIVVDRSMPLMSADSSSYSPSLRLRPKRTVSCNILNHTGGELHAGRNLPGLQPQAEGSKLKPHPKRTVSCSLLNHPGGELRSERSGSRLLDVKQAEGMEAGGGSGGIPRELTLMPGSTTQEADSRENVEYSAVSAVDSMVMDLWDLQEQEGAEVEHLKQKNKLFHPKAKTGETVVPRAWGGHKWG